MESVAKRTVLWVQEFTYLTINSVRNAFSPPRYIVDALAQMDTIGFGSLPIVLLAVGFTGAVLALQSYRTLETYGEVSQVGVVVALSVVRELGPVMTALMVAGRSSTGIASEIGSMLVSEQIDAMRALGTDPMRKLVTPRLFATLVTLPVLTVLADFTALVGGWLVSKGIIHLTTAEFWTAAYQSLTFEDAAQGLIKPIFFSFIVSLVGCYFGLTTTGGTEGVGRSTTRAMVVASVLIIATDFVITQFLIAINFA